MTPSPSRIGQSLVGTKVKEIRRLGKRVLICNESHALVLQPKMTGLVSLDTVPDEEHVRLQIALNGRRTPLIQFWDQRGLGTVELLPLDQIDHRLIAGRLGPDALVITEKQFYDALHSTRRPIKVALLDQKLLAGVGNLYASEMLHLARINPKTASSAVSRSKMNRLHAAMLDILNTAIAHEGSTLSDGTYRNTLNDPGQYQNHHLVYDRADQLCLTCKRSPIRRIVQAQRSTFYCSICQR
jgi:formamidopyrimidine-DNA glycosylase